MNIKYYSREEIVEACEGFINPCNILVDVGCGFVLIFIQIASFMFVLNHLKNISILQKSVFKDLNMLF